MSNFSDILGQDHIKSYLQRAISEDKISHAYIFAGEPLAGKKFMANIFANELVSEKSAKEINIKTLVHAKPSNISVDEIRQQLTDDVHLVPFYGGRKIYIVPDAELMNETVQNKLLKTLEEPPSYVTIILLTTRMESLLPTLRSRCVAFRFLPVSNETIRSYLIEKRGVAKLKAEFAVRFARGNTGRAIYFAEDEKFGDRTRHILDMIESLGNRGIDDLIKSMENIFGAGYKDSDAREEFFHIMLCLIRDLYVYTATSDTESLILRNKSEYISNVAKNMNFRDISVIYEEMLKAKVRIERNVNAEYALQLFMLNARDRLAGG